MTTIHVLDESTINQIAAGEVVERPSAVVKELVENAMDAKATAVTVEIKDGGLSFIRITDNGMGIERDDIPLAFLRHATSKIYKAEDLLCVKSLGFRGEALSSIASVAQVELITKTPTALNGYRYIIEGGIEKSIEEIGCPTGTTIIIRNLFYNTPARKKFLKSAMTEAGYIGDLMEKLLVSHPDVAFKYIVNNQIKLQSSGNNNPKDILYNIYGKDITNELLKLDYSDDKIRVSGYIGKPSVNRSNRSYENYFINGRYIKSNIISKSIEEAYKPFLMQHKYPFTSLYIEIDPSMIDVNVHPQKMELRIRSSEELFQLLYRLIRDTLSGNQLIPKVSLTDHKDNKADTEGRQDKSMPEPFETNRIKQFQHQATQGFANSSTQNQSASGRSLNQQEYGRNNPPYQKLADKNADYISATRPLIQADIPLQGLSGQASDNKGLSPIKAIFTAAGNNAALGDSAAAGDNAGPSDCAAAEENAVQDANKTAGGNSSFSNIPSVDADIAVNENTANNTATSNIAAEQLNLFNLNTSDDNTPFLSAKALEEHRLIGQLFATYWLVEYKKELYIIDQHAAHEKVLYERLMAAAAKKENRSQQLLPPIVLTLTLKEQEILNKHGDILVSLGYEFEHFGGNEYSIRAVPADLYSLSEKTLLLELIDELTEEGIAGLNSSSTVLEKVASLSCKAAVKANNIMSFEEASALIKELLTLENPYNCPHGRPVIISMSKYELERKFKRII